MAGRTERIEFSGSQGATLAARLELPGGEPRAYALFVHCFTCGKDVAAAARISRSLTEFGIAVLRFDFTELGHSGGEFGNTNFTSNVDDVVYAADFLRERHGAPVVLIGHSLGGAAALAAAPRVPDVRAVATIGAPADPQHVTDLLGERAHDVRSRGEAEVVLAGRSFRIRRQFLEDIAAQPQAERLANLGAALLVLHSPTDDTVGVDNARRIFDAARHPKSFVALDGADHLLSSRTDAEFVATVLASWAGRYALSPAIGHADSGEAGGSGEAAVPGNQGSESEEGTVVVTESGNGQFRQRITAGRHVLAADEPRPVGDDTGPSPYDLLLAGLGACTSMTIRMYARRKEWPLEGVTVSLRHEHIHARDCAECETRSGKVDRIERVIRLDGELDTEQRRKLLDIANKCPVHRTLHTETVVNTTEANETAPADGGSDGDPRFG